MKPPEPLHSTWESMSHAHDQTDPIPDPIPSAAPVPRAPSQPSPVAVKRGIPPLGVVDHAIDREEGTQDFNGYCKPRGRANRPRSGGYNLEKHLLANCNWMKSEFQEVQVVPIPGHYIL